MGKHVISKVSEIPPGERKLVDIGGRSIGVFNIKGEYFAIRNQCAHQGGPLCQGRLTGFLKSSMPGEYSYIRKGEFLRCPWHGWEFDIKTGKSWWNPANTRVKSYNADAVSGEELSGPQEGPLAVETYPVSVDESYVVVEVP